VPFSIRVPDAIKLEVGVERLGILATADDRAVLETGIVED
jgi:hypothetical protein